MGPAISSFAVSPDGSKIAVLRPAAWEVLATDNGARRSDNRRHRARKQVAHGKFMRIGKLHVFSGHNINVRRDILKEFLCHVITAAMVRQLQQIDVDLSICRQALVPWDSIIASQACRASLGSGLSISRPWIRIPSSSSTKSMK